MIHKYNTRIYYRDTDKMGVAYYANFFVWFEEARTEFFRDAGFPYKLVEEQDIYLPVIEASCKYSAPAAYDDVIEVSSWIFFFRGVRIGFRYEVRKNGEPDIIATGETMHAFINKLRKPARVPEKLKDVINSVKEEGREAGSKL